MLVPVLLGLGLSGCSSTPADPAGQSATPTSSAEGDASERPEQTPASGSPSATAGSANPRSGSSSGEVLATRTSGFNGGQVRADVLTLRRTGELLNLEIQLTAVSGDSLIDSGVFKAKPGVTGVTGISLVDAGNKKRYLPAKDSAGGCLCSDADFILRTGGSTIVSATYAAPPADVTALSVELPSFGTFADLPVSG
ncbi:MAG: hypothetical protein ACR2K2_13500 [Mycobacteriales bacterium]